MDVDFEVGLYLELISFEAEVRLDSLHIIPIEIVAPEDIHLTFALRVGVVHSHWVLPLTIKRELR